MHAAQEKDAQIEKLHAQLRRCVKAGSDALTATGLDATASEETQAAGGRTPLDTMVCDALSKLRAGFLEVIAVIVSAHPQPLPQYLH